MWNALSGVINCWIGAAVQFQYVLHGLRAGRGTGTASLEAKYFQQLMAMRDEFLYKVFLDLRKVYDALNR